jgi:glutamate/tyrosine decarboxylase-like PLP-dependent enzyme
MLRPRAGFDGSRVESVLSPSARSALEAIGRAESVTIDPHKLGYVPYASGAFLAIDARDYTCVEILAPYLDYQKDNLAPTVSHPYSDRGPYTLEGSRSGAGAVATWLTARSIGLDQSGYGLLLARTISQKRKVERWLTDHLSSARVYRGCDTNVLCFCVADQGEPISATNQRTLRIMTRLAEASAYFVSKTELPLEGRHSSVPREFAAVWSAQIDHGHLTMLRMCLMNPFFDSSELDTDHIQNLVFSLCELAD